MSIIKELLGLEKDLDKVAHKDIEQMGLRLRSLYDNLNHLKIVFGMIEKAKREGKEIKPTVRENFFATLAAIKKQLGIEIQLEEEIKNVERAEEEKKEKNSGYPFIQRSKIEIRNSNNEFLIGSSPECDLRINNLAKKQVGLWSTNRSGITIVSYRNTAQIRTSKGMERIYGTTLTYEKNFDLHLVSSNGIIIVYIRG